MRKAVRKEALHGIGSSFYLKIHKTFSQKNSIEMLFFCISALHQILRFIILFLSFIILLKVWIQSGKVELSFSFRVAEVTLLSLFLLFLFTFIDDILPRTWAYFSPEGVLKLTSPVTSALFLVSFPFLYIQYRLIYVLFPKALIPFGELRVNSKETLLDIISDIDDGTLLSKTDKKLLQSVLHFRDRIVREIMVPRVELFCLSGDTTIRASAELLKKEGYSRIPVYKNTQDHIVGILMYKEIISKYVEYSQNPFESTILEESIEDIIKPALYIPETKKLSQLLQDFRKKRIHIAVVVDEYGGTAGIVTIEDILEEIVGDIADEYDEAESFFHPSGKSSWIVDAKTSLVDVDEELGIKIPQEGDYDTVSGYIFYRLGTIPRPGTIIHHDYFEIEILKSDDRTVEQVKITPLGTLSHKDR